MNEKTRVNGVLLIFNHPLVKNAPTIMEHVDAFCRHSRFKVWKVNTELGFPKKLQELQFQAIVLHYSLFGYKPILSKEFLRYLEDSRQSYKIAFFQDEHRFCKMRFDLINHYKLDCVFTLVEPPFFDQTYRKYTKIPKLVYCIPGYVSDEMLAAARKFSLEEAERSIDIGYRGRNLDYYMGKGSQEKYEIAVKFREMAMGLGLQLDIEAEESKRIYGDKWYRFVANCRGLLGVEAGVSIFDLEDTMYEAYTKLMAKDPKMSFDEVSQKLNFRDWEDRIYYRTISPRHFEAAAFKVCQILFEGKYSGVMKPMVHYIPLKKDFANFEEVVRLFKDPAVRRELTENAYRDLVLSGRYTYKTFVESRFDTVLIEAGVRSAIEEEESEKITNLLNVGISLRNLHALMKSARMYPFPGRSLLLPLVKPLLQKYDRWREQRA